MRNGKVVLHEIGVALYGNGWESKIAKDLDTDGRMVRRWLNGTAIIPDSVWPKLRERLQLRKLEMGVLIDQLG